jgi:hypothetical protein
MSILAILAVLALFPQFRTFSWAQIVKSLWFAPGVAITRVYIVSTSFSHILTKKNMFQVTVTVPSLPSGSGAHGVWPGVGKDGAGFVFQGVINDSKALVLG